MMQRGVKLIALISTAATLLFAAVYIPSRIGIFLTLAITCGTTAYHFLMRLAVGGIINGIFRNDISYELKWFKERKFEKALYAKLNVKKWKRNIPTYSPDTFSTEKHSYEEIAKATCQAELVHEIIALLSFLPISAIPVFGAWPVFLVTSLIAAGIDLFFATVQRYNRPRIIRLIRAQKKTT